MFFKKCEARQPVRQWRVIAMALVFTNPVTLMWYFSAWVVMNEPVISSMWMEGEVICLPLFCLLFP